MGEEKFVCLNVLGNGERVWQRFAFVPLARERAAGDMYTPCLYLAKVVSWPTFLVAPSERATPAYRRYRDILSSLAEDVRSDQKNGSRCRATTGPQKWDCCDRYDLLIHDMMSAEAQEKRSR